MASGRLTTGWSALRQFGKLHGSLSKLTTTFVVPHNGEWAAELHGFTLGTFIRSIRKCGPERFKKRNPQLFKELNDSEFVWDKKYVRREKLVTSMVTFKSLFGHVNIPQHFQVPSDDDRWPALTRGYHLGISARNIRNLNCNESLRGVFESLGFDFDYQKRPHDFDVMYEALLAFRKLSGHYLVPYSFVVPHSDPHYLSESWGLELGRFVSSILQNNTYRKDHNDKLLAIGFHYTSREEIKFELLLEALRTYQQYFGHLEVPKNWKIPYGSALYPRPLWKRSLHHVLRTWMSNPKFHPFLPQIESELGLRLSIDEQGKLVIGNGFDAVSRKPHNANLQLGFEIK